jgi:hypothetical protein
MASEPVVSRPPGIRAATINTSVERTGNGHCAARLVGIVDALPEFERNGACAACRPRGEQKPEK